MKKTYREKDINKLATLLLKQITRKPQQQANVLAFVGELGAGKTTLAKSLALTLGIKEEVVSPTFVISKTYNISGHKKFKKLIHIDAYRLKDKRDLDNIGFFEQLADKDNLIIVEWADLVYKWLPSHTKKVLFKYESRDSRNISF